MRLKLALLVALAVVCASCEASNPFPLMTPQPASTQPTSRALINAQADTREIGKTLAESSANMQSIAVDVRSDAKSAPEPVRAALEGRADRLVHESAAVGAQAKLVDPGVTRQLESALDQLATMQAENEKIVAGLVAQNATTQKQLSETTEKLKDARSLRLAAWFLLGGVVAGVALVACKAHPAMAWIPGELGGGIAGGCLLGLLYIHTRDEYPMATAIGGFALMLALVVPTVIRLNNLQSKVAT
jgi:hypothetical protein